MALTDKLGSRAMIRAVDTGTLAPKTTIGPIDQAKTDYLKITGNGAEIAGAVVTRKATIQATNDDATVINVHLELAGKGAGVVLLPQIATASLPAAAAGNKGGIVYDSTTNTLKVSNGSAWVTVGTQI